MNPWVALHPPTRSKASDLVNKYTNKPQADTPPITTVNNNTMNTITAHASYFRMTVIRKGYGYGIHLPLSDLIHAVDLDLTHSEKQVHDICVFPVIAAATEWTTKWNFPAEVSVFGMN